MDDERLTHASFFSGVGGLDLGLERAGWRTVSFSEIEPYASAVLAERWPGIPNLGDIVALAAGRADANGDGGGWDLADRSEARNKAGCEDRGRDASRRLQPRYDGSSGNGGGSSGVDWTDATLWSGGFPCQDLSVAGKRRGLAGERSGLAFAFLDLVERHRPRWILLENVPGLLNSHKGRDMAALLDRLADLGYGVAWRVLDARYFGVPQRRRRVFILATNDPGGRAGAERAAAVLAVAASGGGHPAPGGEARTGAASGAGVGAEIVGALRGRDSKGVGFDFEVNGQLLVGAPPDPGRVRAADGLAGRLDDRERLAPTMNSNKAGGWRYDADQVEMLVEAGPPADDPLLPLGLDSHRYRCCGNGVVANVAEAVGLALAQEVLA